MDEKPVSTRQSDGKRLVQLVMASRLAFSPDRNDDALSDREMSVLFFLAFHRDPSVQEVAATLGMLPNTVSTQLRALIATKKLVERVIDSTDARIHRLRLTRRGDLLLDRLLTSRGRQVDGFLETLFRNHELSVGDRDALTRCIVCAGNVLHQTLAQRRSGHP